MSHKTIKPDLDLILARFAIFGILAILFAVPSINGHPSWLTWVVMLWGVFSIFEAAIKADEDALAANGLAKIIISHSGKLASERDELKKSIQGSQGRIAELERLNRVKVQTILDLHEEIKELKASHHGEMIGHEVHLKQAKKNRDELENQVNAFRHLIRGLRSEFDLWMDVECPQVERQIELLEETLKGN